jgi:hypothetical protein
VPTSGSLWRLWKLGIGGGYPLEAYLRLNVGNVPEGATAAVSLPASVRDALVALVRPLAHWRGPRAHGAGRGRLVQLAGQEMRDVLHPDVTILELERFGLPGNLGSLAAWIGIPLSSMDWNLCSEYCSGR